MKRSMSVLLAAAMCSAMLAGCGSTAADTAADASAATEATASSASAEGVNVFKIGGTSPLTGAAAIYGNAVKNGAQIAVDEINEAGGSVQFELKYEDDENDPEKAVSAYNALKDWGMQISLASVTTKPCEATSTEHFADRIFGLTPSASSTAITEGKDNVFQMWYSMTFNVTTRPGTDKLVLNAILNQRSQDVLAANNWNVCQYAVLMHMLAQVCDMEVGELVHVIADAHIYDRHIPLVQELITREQHPAPKFWLNPEIKDFYAFTEDDIRLDNYVTGPQIKNIPIAV